MKRNALTTVLALAATLSATGAVHAALVGSQYLKQAKVPLHTARALALKAYPGKLVSEELERERGGSGLRYSFDVRGAAGVHEVGIDAVTGKLLENSKEGPDAD